VNLILQIIAISVMNLKSIPARMGSSLVIVVGIGGVVMVLVALLAMSKGLSATLAGTGSNDRVIILRDGSKSEVNGNITLDQANVISNLPGLLRYKGESLIASESFVSVNLRKKSNGDEAFVSFRGVEEKSFQIRSEVEVVAGRRMQFGKFELLVGKGLVNQFQELDIGSTIILRNTPWQIVGHFSSQGGINESELWTDVKMLNSVFNRGITTMLARLQSSDSYATLDTAMKNDRRLTSKVHRESAFYQAQSSSTNQIISAVAVVISSIMGLGAVFAVLNTMYSAVSLRTVEIGVLRALGFGSTPIVVSVFLESLCLAVIGGGIGSALTYALFNGFSASTTGEVTQVSFVFLVSTQIMAMGILIAAALGSIGGLFPSISAVRKPITVALREL